ncbi:MAG: prepilin-type N-terminal cleavage/methylation domain-containing protein [Prochlorococcaceae cyanobacterium]|jgi:prepilin-type N-terminal cleavage/methylation domain-containing protein
MRRLVSSPQICRAGDRPDRGFTLIELLLALTLGLLLCGVIVQALLAEGRNSLRFGRHLRERQGQWRTLELLRHDLRQSLTAVVGAGDGSSSCGLAGRRAVLQLEAPEGRITYSVGSAPAPIWRGQVLVRCGPAFGLYGELQGGDPLSRVVIDALPAGEGGFSGRLNGRGGVVLELLQEFPLEAGQSQQLRSEITAALP